jgi:hypothetical protein
LEKLGAMTNLIKFCKYTKKDYEMIATQGWVWIHQRITDKLEAVERWEIKRLMIFVRPRMWKSELASIRFPTWCLWRNSKRKIVIASYWSDLASDFWRKWKQVVEWQEFKNIFTDFNLSKDKREWWNWETSKWWWVYTIWVWWALAWKWFDIWIIDDPVKDRLEAESPTTQQRVIEWYTSTFFTRKQSQDSAIILMMTRWNVNDLAWYLLNEEKNWGDKWEVLTIPAIDKEWNEIIWEWKWDKWHILSEKANISPKDWAALYQQDPIASSSNIFKLSDLRYYLQSDFEREDWILKKEDLKCIISVDPAFSSSWQSDDAVVLWIWKHKLTGNYYQLDWYAWTSAPSQTFQVILSMYDSMTMDWYKIEFIWVEKVNINKQQTKFIEDLKVFLKAKWRYITVTEYDPKGKKEDRIKFNLEPKVSLNAIYLRKDMADKSFIRRLEDQLYQFPNSKKDDIMDCLTQWVDILEYKKEIKIRNRPRQFYNKLTGQVTQIE